MSGEATPAGREDVARRVRAPELASVAPAVEGDEQLVALDLLDRGRTDERRILGVDGLELVSDAELVAQWSSGRLLEALLAGEHVLAGRLYELLQELGPLAQIVAVPERRRDLASVLGRVLERVYEIRVAHEPEVVAVVGAVEAQTHARSHCLDHRADACGRGVAGIVRLELVADAELVARRLRVLTEARGRRRLRRRLGQVVRPRERVVAQLFNAKQSYTLVYWFTFQFSHNSRLPSNVCSFFPTIMVFLLIPVSTRLVRCCLCPFRSIWNLKW